MSGAPPCLWAASQAVAETLTKIHLPSHRTVKARLRSAGIAAVRAAIDGEITLEAYQRSAGSCSSLAEVEAALGL